MSNKKDPERMIKAALERGHERYAAGTYSKDDLKLALEVIERAMYQALILEGVLNGLVDLVVAGGQLHFTLNAKGVEMGLDSILEDKPKH